jgi:hypothetical protein
MKRKPKISDYKEISITLKCKCGSGLLLDIHPTRERVMEYRDEVTCIYCGRKMKNDAVILLKKIYKIEKLKNIINGKI